MDAHVIFDSAELHLVEVECGRETRRIDFVSRLLLRAVGNMTVLEVTCTPGGEQLVERYAFPLDGVNMYNWKKQPAEYTEARRKQMDTPKTKDEGGCTGHGDLKAKMEAAGFVVIDGPEAKDMLMQVLGNG